MRSKPARAGSSRWSARTETNTFVICRRSSATERASWLSPPPIASAALSRPMRRLRPPASTSPYTAVRSSVRVVIVTLASGLGDQPGLADHDVVGQRLAHVVDGQRSDARAGQRLHLHAR